MLDARPEKALLMAMLERAILDFLKKTEYSPGRTSVYENPQETASRWLLESVREAPFTFIWTCDMLDLNKDLIRQNIIEIKERGESLRASHLWSDAVYGCLEHVYSSPNDAELYIC